MSAKSWSAKSTDLQHQPGLIKWSGTETEFFGMHKIKEIHKNKTTMTVVFFGKLLTSINDVIELDNDLYVVRRIDYRADYAEFGHPGETEVQFAKIILAEDSPEARQELLQNLSSQSRANGPFWRPCRAA